MQSVHAGLSIAVIHDYKIAWAKGFGVTAPGGSEPVTTTTLFQAGSISKSVATIGALGLVEHGKLSLDEDVNQKLKTWKVREASIPWCVPLRLESARPQTHPPAGLHAPTSSTILDQRYIRWVPVHPSSFHCLSNTMG